MPSCPVHLSFTAYITLFLTFHRYCATSTGCGRRSESTTRLLFTYIGVCTDLLRRTCLLIYGASRTCRQDSDYVHGRRTRWPSRRRTCPLSATALSRLPLHESGTLSYRWMFGHSVICQRSSVGSRPSSAHEASLTNACAACIFIFFVRWPRSFG